MKEEVVELTEVRRRVIFVALVAPRDEGLSVRESRTTIPCRFKVDLETVVEVEDEGLDVTWPPFGNG